MTPCASSCRQYRTFVCNHGVLYLHWVSLIEWCMIAFQWYIATVQQFFGYRTEEEVARSQCGKVAQQVTIWEREWVNYHSCLGSHNFAIRNCGFHTHKSASPQDRQILNIFRSIVLLHFIFWPCLSIYQLYIEFHFVLYTFATKIANCIFHHLYPTFCQHATTRELLNRFARNLILETFTKINQHVQISPKIEQHLWTVYMKTYMGFSANSVRNFAKCLSKRKMFQDKSSSFNKNTSLCPNTLLLLGLQFMG
jgi:hypothetical protein